MTLQLRRSLVPGKPGTRNHTDLLTCEASLRQHTGTRYLPTLRKGRARSGHEWAAVVSVQCCRRQSPRRCDMGTHFGCLLHSKAKRLVVPRWRVPLLHSAKRRAKLDDRPARSTCSLTRSWSDTLLDLLASRRGPNHPTACTRLRNAQRRLADKAAFTSNPRNSLGTVNEERSTMNV